MGEIFVPELGQNVTIAGDKPTKEEAQTILGAIQAQQSEIPTGPVEPPIDTGGGPPPIPTPSQQVGPALAPPQPVREFIERNARAAVGREALGMAGAAAGGIFAGVTGGTGPAATSVGQMGTQAASRMASKLFARKVLATVGTRGTIQTLRGLGAGALGEAGGNVAADVLTATEAYFDGQPVPEEVTIRNSTINALKQGGLDLTASMGVDSFMKVAKTATKFLPRFAFIGGKAKLKQAQKLAAQAGGGIGLNIATAGQTGLTKGATRVFSVFPFLNTPFKNRQGNINNLIAEQAADLLDTFAARGTKFEIARDLSRSAAANWKASNRIVTALFKDFRQSADALAEEFGEDAAKIVPTQGVKQSLFDWLAKLKAESPVKEPMEAFVERTFPEGNPMRDVVRLVSDSEPFINVRQFHGLSRQLNAGIDASKGSLDINTANGIKDALTESLDKLRLDGIPEDRARELLAKRATANEFFGKFKDIFKSPTAKRFTAADPNIFSPKRFKGAGRVNTDEIFDAAFRTRSPEALDDLKKLVSPTAFRKASRRYIEGSLLRSIRPVEQGSTSFDQFDASLFEKALGLDTPEGAAVLQKVLDDTGVKVGDFMTFMNLARAGTDIKIRDPNTFLTRRIVLSGLQGGLAGGLLVGGANKNIRLPVVGLITAAARGGAEFLTNPKALRWLIRASDETIPQSERNRLVARFFTAFVPADEGQN